MSTLKIKWFDLFTFKGSTKLISLMAVGLIFSAALGGIVPKLIIDLGVKYSDTDQFYHSIFLLGVLFIFVYLNHSFYEYIGNRYVIRLIQHVRSKSYSSWILSYDIKSGKQSNRELYPQGEVIARIISDTEVLRDLVTSGTLGLFIDIFFVFSCLISFVLINKVTGGALVFAEVLAVILLLRGTRYMRVVFNRVRHAQGNVSRTLANVMGGIHEMYYTRNDRYASKKGKKAFDVFLKTQLSSNLWDASYFALAESLYPLLLALVVFVFPHSKITEMAIIFALVDLIQRSIDPIKRVSGKVANIQRALTGITRIGEFVSDLEGSVSTPYGRTPDSKMDFDEMVVTIPTFYYENNEGRGSDFALKDIKLTAKRGELIGIVGLSGCGKSTLLNIIAGNIIPKNSSIVLKSRKGDSFSFPGNDMMDIINYRDKVGIVSQDSHIFTESVYFNISMNLVPRNEFDTFWQWIIGEIPYIKKWGLKSDDTIDPKKISLGQKQLLSAIRACLLKRPVILFDEISSALDSELEHALRQVVLLIQKYSLTIVVTHRIETIFGANSIIVMKNGLITDRGTHKELSQHSQNYQEFIQKMSEKTSI
ncbi:MAG: ABC transporter ATP-binding protein [Bacteriovoracaceae bacterium]|nr:ABC transporter ATP-binding protein [Bacteriovoracaceae bacterium]